MHRALLSSSKCLSRSVLFRGISTSQAALGGFTRDFKPGPYPKTEAERVAAAKKYGLLPQDYKPMPDDGIGFGDYPDLGKVSTDMKSDWENWDDPYGKRNFGDPYHIQAELLTADKASMKPLHQPYWKIFLYWCLGWGSFFGIYYLTYNFKAALPLTPKQYPRRAVPGGEKHYSF